MGSMGALPYLTSVLTSCGSVKERYVPINLTQEQYDTVWHMAERILPRTLTPGAADAGVAAYFDTLFSGYLDQEAVQEILGKLEVFMANCLEKFEKGFDKLTGDQQIAYLNEIASDEESFYQDIRGISLWAYYTSEVGVKSMDYQPVPGKYNGCETVVETTKNLIGNRW